MTTRLRTAEERRAAIQAEAKSLHIDEAYISLLVDEFYRRVRKDERLGPIFNEVIGDHWEEHLVKLKDFWASVALNAGRYSGKPVPAHIKLSEVTRADFEKWLTLFEQTLLDTAPHPQVVPYFMERADRIARSLQLAMFGSPQFPVDR